MWYVSLHLYMFSLVPHPSRTNVIVTPLLLYQPYHVYLGDEYRDAAALVLRGEDKTFCSGADLGKSPIIPGGT